MPIPENSKYRFNRKSNEERRAYEARMRALGLDLSEYDDTEDEIPARTNRGSRPDLYLTFRQGIASAKSKEYDTYGGQEVLDTNVSPDMTAATSGADRPSPRHKRHGRNTRSIRRRDR